MKTSKEFSATHSMSTSWFVADEDGNIALFYFDENGPVPVDIPEQSSSSLMTAEEDFGQKDSNFIEYLELTDKQIEELMSDAVTPDKYDIENEYNLFVQIDEAHKKEFLEVFKDDVECCLSHKHGIYFVFSLFEYDENLKQIRERRLKTFYKTVKRVVHIYADECLEEEYPGVNIKWPLPFYAYKQPYDSYDELVKRVNVPKFPFKENQIPEKQRDKLIRIPVKFSECSGFQIAQYAICNWYSGIEEIKRKKRTYTKFPKTGGGFCYILQDQNREKDGETPIVLPAGDN
ncbi:MAG: hypothetical protein VZR56_01010 [Treponema sp.]|nr:hypothetical protein [Treponema sp.]